MAHKVMVENTLKILFIDDEPLVRDAFALALRPPAFNTICVASAQEGLKLCEGATFDVIITDLLMPEMDGLDLIREIRALEIETPIITISGGARIGQQNLMQKAIHDGAAMSLRKPISRQDIIKAIHDTLEMTTL